MSCVRDELWGSSCMFRLVMMCFWVCFATTREEKISFRASHDDFGLFVVIERLMQTGPEHSGAC